MIFQFYFHDQSFVVEKKALVEYVIFFGYARTEDTLALYLQQL